jgi:tRNA A37 threonylcarbamoyladenosine synthetase subunit TsaC/SUA5/YrdC
VTSALDPIQAAARAALDGSLIVLPTDTVYGIGARPDDPSATARLFEAKGRPRELELPVLVPSTEAARRIATFDERAEALALRFWAGRLTIVLPRTRSLARGTSAETRRRSASGCRTSRSPSQCSREPARSR